MKILLGAVVLIASAHIAGCGGGSSNNSPPVPTYTIGGTIAGLSGSGLVLQLNGGGNLGVSANGPFAFATALVAGSSYNVTLLAHSTSQTCTVTDGGGTVGSANVTTVNVTCVNGFSIAAVSDPLAAQQWHLKNTGQAAFADSGGVPGMDINVDPVFTSFGYSGNGVIVAVVDSGLEIAHEDLAANVVPGGSWDFVNNDTDPTNTVDTDGDHGTSVSGLIAMARNSVGGIGVAPSARLKGFNFLSSTQTLPDFLDSIGGSTANPNSSDVFVFNESFGISPSGSTTIEPTVEAQYLFGVTNLRGGKGALYVKAAGNGFNGICPVTGLSCENANFDPDNTIPFQVVVGATNADGIKASYSTAGSAIWVSAPGGGGGFNALVSGSGFSPEAFEPAMVTADQSGCAAGLARTAANTSFFDRGTQNANCNYTNSMNGTSSATPVTAGVIALMLEANPALGWRDVKYVLAFTARQIDAGRAAVNIALTGGNYVAEPPWTTNAAGFKFHNWYGFGMVDAAAAVGLARTYNLAQLGAFVNTGFISSGALSLPIPDASVVGAISTLAVPANPVNVIEAVQIRVNVTHTFTGDLGIELISPSGTRSVLKNIADQFFISDNLTDMVLLSNAFYGENPFGTWTIKVVDGLTGDVGTLTNWAIRVYGH
jgi:subtilisin-like proprotein convertase family protein/subtilisin family serine protease